MSALVCTTHRLYVKSAAQKNSGATELQDAELQMPKRYVESREIEYI